MRRNTQPFRRHKRYFLLYIYAVCKLSPLLFSLSVLSCVVLLLSSVRSLRDLSKIVRMLDKSNIKLSNILNKDAALSYMCHTKTCCSCSVSNFGEKNVSDFLR